jgi:hypothetical protein
MRREMREVASILERLQMEVRQVGEREERERAMILLRMENLLLRRPEVLALPEAGG